MSNSASRAGRSARGKGRRRKARAELAGALRAAVGDREQARLARREVGRRELDHLARADEQHLGLAQVLEQLRGEANRRRRHADRVGADLGRRAHFLGDRERALEHLLQRAAERAGAARLAHRLLQLAEDLRLAEDHRIEAARDPERVARRRRAFEHVGVRAQRRRLHAAHVGEPVHRRRERARGGADVDLGAVAGRHDRDFLDRLEARRGTPSASSPAAAGRARNGRANRAARSCG